MYIGQANLSYVATGQASSPDVNGGNPFNVANNAQFQSDLEEERARLEEDLEDFEFWPILNISLGYRF